MNPRIRELIKQATEYYGNGSERTFDREKFAELLVKDFITMCTELQTQYFIVRKNTRDFGEKNIYAEGETACGILLNKMKGHFGCLE